MSSPNPKTGRAILAKLAGSLSVPLAPSPEKPMAPTYESAPPARPIEVRRPKAFDTDFRLAPVRYNAHVWSTLMGVIGLPCWTPKMRNVAYRALGLDMPPCARFAPGCYISQEGVVIGKNFAASERCLIDRCVAIEDNVRFGAKVHVLTSSHRGGSAERRRGPIDTVTPVTIGAGSWLYVGATVVCSDVAAGCEIAVGAVVTRSTEAHGFYAGVPARRVRDLPVGLVS